MKKYISKWKIARPMTPVLLICNKIDLNPKADGQNYAIATSNAYEIKYTSITKN